MRPRPNILFVNLPSIPLEEVAKMISGRSYYRQSIAMPMGLLYISGYMRESVKVADVSLIDFALLLVNAPSCDTIDEFIDTALSQVDHTPDVVGISLIFSAAYKFFTLLSAAIKRHWPDAKVVVGGNHATSASQTILEHNVDHVICGEGEIVFSEFLQGIWTDRVISAPPINDLDGLPYPDWNLLDMEQYVTARGRARTQFAKLSRSATIITTRGCPNRCTFCAAHVIHGYKVRLRSIDNVLHEMRLLHEKYGVNLFIPEDDLFLFRKKRVLVLLKGIAGLQIPDLELQFPNGLSVASLDEDILKALKTVGVRTINIAIESGSAHVQGMIKKNCDLKKAAELVKTARQMKFFVRCYFIMGFYRETAAHMEETRQYILGLQADWCLVHPVAPIIGSEMYNQFMDRDDITAPGVWDDGNFQVRSFDTEEITAEDLLQKCYSLNLEINFRNNINILQGDFGRAREQFLDVLNKFPYHIFAIQGLYFCAIGQARGLLATDGQAQELYQEHQDLLDSQFKITIKDG